MEEKIIITVLDQTMLLDHHDFQEMTELISSKKLNEMSSGLKRTGLNLEVLHACMYYIIVIQREIPGSAELKERYLESIVRNYIGSKLSFDLYGYSSLSSKILSCRLEECIHTIYFFFYGRLASKPYVSALIRKQKLTEIIRVQKPSHFHSRVLSTNPRPTILFDHSHLEQQIFTKELRDSLFPNAAQEQKNRKIKYKIDKAKLRKRTFEQEDKSEDNLRKTQTFARSKEYHQTVPFKIGFEQNSSIFEFVRQLSMPKKDVGKMKMRKQKFNENFDANEKIYRHFLKKAQTKSKQQIEAGEDHKESKSLLRFSKQPEFFKQLITGIRTQNSHLDQIFLACNRRNSHQEQSKQVFSKQANEPDSMGSVIVSTPQEKENQENKKIVPSRNYRTSLIHVNSKALNESSFGEQLGHRNIVESREFQTSIQAYHKVGKVKPKAQNYKNEYRDFLKTKMFEAMHFSS